MTTNLHSDPREQAVEVARYRAALRAAEAHMTNPKGGRGCVCRCSVIDGHTGDCVVIAALATPPTAAVKAVEGMRKALERLSLGPDCGCKPCVGQCRTKGSLEIELLERIDFARAALAAWKEATRG